MAGPYVPNQLLSRLVADRMYSTEFVLNEHLQFRFDGPPGATGPVTLTSWTWPIIEAGGRVWREGDLGYADAVRRLAPGDVLSTVEARGSGIRIELDTGTIVIHPHRDEADVEIAMISGWPDGASMVWRPGEDSFEDLGA